VVSAGAPLEKDGAVKGAKLLVAGYGGTPIKLDDEQLFFVKDSDIMAVIS